jgi:copper chaperone CopZ
MPEAEEDFQLTDRWVEEKCPADDYPGFVRIPAPEPEVESDPTKDPLWGWTKDADGGYVRVPESELPPVPRKGTWCKVFGLTQRGDMNDTIVECISEEPDDLVQIAFDGDEHFLIKAINLAPLPGSEKMLSLHGTHTLQVNGINCKSCKESLLTALTAVEGVSETATTIKTKEETGAHPNPVMLKGKIDVEKVKAAISALDAGRGKFTIAA